jgi:hypothetical protein
MTSRGRLGRPGAAAGEEEQERKREGQGGEGEEGEAEQDEKAAAVPVPSVHYPFLVSVEDSATGSRQQQQQQRAEERERERQRNVTVLPRPTVQSRSEEHRMHTARTRRGAHAERGRARGAHHRRLIHIFSSFLPSFLFFLSIDASWLLSFLSTYFFFFHLCDSTRIHI